MHIKDCKTVYLEMDKIIPSLGFPFMRNFGVSVNVWKKLSGKKNATIIKIYNIIIYNYNIVYLS